MAELHVQRKRNSFLWLWLFLIVLLIAGGIYYYMHNKNPQAYPLPTKSTGSVMHRDLPPSTTFVS
jgi:hypothetical protein